MNVATVLDNACPFFIILKHKGTIYVCIKKFIAIESLSFTNAPITPKDVTRRFSKIFVLVEVFKNGYRKRGIWAKFIRDYYHLEIIVEFVDEEQGIVEDPLLNRFD